MMMWWNENVSWGFLPVVKVKQKPFSITRVGVCCIRFVKTEIKFSGKKNQSRNTLNGECWVATKYDSDRKLFPQQAVVRVWQKGFRSDRVFMGLFQCLLGLKLTSTNWQLFSISCSIPWCQTHLLPKLTWHDTAERMCEDDTYSPLHKNSSPWIFLYL